MSAGKRVSAGRLRVDAARAVDKLREYQLPDPRLWVLEVVRAAVAQGATRIEVSGDADDVRVAWEGPPLPHDSLARLFDELVDPSPRADRRALRLLATGVNTALGLDPRWLDVLSIDGEGGAARARYTTRLLEMSADGSAERLRALESESVTPPAGAPTRGGLVHLRRLPLWDAVPLLIGYGEPRELSVVRQSCDDLAVPLRVGRSELGRERSHRDLLRVGLGESLDGFLALVEPTGAGAEAFLDVAEHGVVLARYTLPLGSLSSARAPVPLRLFITAPRMPTNASRSGVRLDDPPVREAIERGRALLPTLVERLVTELSAEPEHAWTATQRDRLRAAAITLLAAHCAGRQWRNRLQPTDPSSPLPVWLVPLAEQTLLRDALGRPRSPTSFAAQVEEERVHFGREPLGRELEPWLGDSLWIPPGDAATVLLGGWTPPRAAELAKRARKFTRARETFWATKRREAKLTPDSRAVLKVTIEAPGRSLKSLVDEAPFAVAGLAGELALVDLGSRAAELSVRIAGREIEQMQLDRPLAFRAVATCDGLTPRYDFRAAQRDGQLARLVAAVDAAAIIACEALALRFEGEAAKPGDRATLLVPPLENAAPAFRARVADTLRAGLVTAFEWIRAGGVDDHDAVRARLRAGRSPLLEAAIWPTARGGALSTKALLQRASKPHGRIGYVVGRVHATGVPPQPEVLVVTRNQVAILAQLVGYEVLLDYGAALADLGRRGPLITHVTPVLGVGLRIDGAASAAVAWGSKEARLDVFHWGARLHTEALHGRPLVRAAVDDPRLVPDPDFRRALHPEQPRYRVERWSRRLARAFVDVLAGAAPPEAMMLTTDDPLQATAAVRALLVGIAEQDDLDGWLGGRRVAALRRVPLFRALGVEASVSAADLMAAHATSIPWIPPRAAPAAPPGFRPVVCDEIEQLALARLSGRELRDARVELETLRRQASRVDALTRLRERPTMDATRNWTAPIVPVKGKGYREAAATFALTVGAEVTVLIEGRFFKVHHDPEGLPVRAFVDLEEECVDEDFADLNKLGWRRLRYVLAAGARTLVLRGARADPAGLVESTSSWRLLCAWAESLDTSSLTKRDRKILEQLCTVEAFPSVQGERVALADAVQGKTLRVAFWDEPWLARGPSERASAFDTWVVALPRDEGRRAQLRSLLRVLWRRRVQDVTSGVERLQTTRRVARGLTEVPRLAEVADARFRYALDDVLANDQDALETLGVGEVALSRGEMTVVHLVAEGAQTQRLELNLIPRIEVAVLSPLVRAGRRLSPQKRDKIEAAITTVTARVLRRVIDATPGDQLPRWVRDALRQSCLAGGAEFFDRVLETPIFQTTSFGWVSPKQVAADVERWGELWTTPDASAGPPLDDRLAVRLTKDQRSQLEAWVPAIDATEELAFDEAKRRNMARAPLPSLEPTPEIAAAAAHVIRIEPTADDPLVGTIAVLRPGFADRRGLRISRARHPLGELSDPSRWPAAACLDHPALEPDRTWAAPKRDATLMSIEGRVRREVWRALVSLVPRRRGARYETRVRPSGDDARIVEGAAHLVEDGTPGRLVVLDPRGERSVEPSGGLPVSGTLWFAEPISDIELAPYARSIYRLLLERVVDRLVAVTAPTHDVVHVLRAIRLGCAPKKDRLERIELLATRPALAVSDVLKSARSAERYAVCAPDELEAAEAVGLPLIIDDGGPISDELLRLFEGRCQPFRDVLTAQLFGPDETDHPRTASAAARPIAPPIEPPESAGASALELALEQLLPFGFGGVKTVRVVADDKRPIARLERRTGLVLAGRHPALVAARQALESNSPDAQTILRLVLARAAGSLQRAHGRFMDAGQLDALTALLRAQ